MAFRRPLKYNVNKNNPLNQTGGDQEFSLMSNDDIDRIRQLAIYELFKDPIYRLMVTLGSEPDRLDKISDTRVRSGPALDGTVSSYPASDDVLSTVNTDYQRLRDSQDSSGFDANAYEYLANTTPRPLCLDSDRGHIIMQMPLQDVIDTLFKPALDSFYSDPTNLGDSDNKMRPGLYLIGGYAGTPTNPNNMQLLESSDPIFIDTFTNTGGYSAGAIGTTGTFQDHFTTGTSYYLYKTHNLDSGLEHIVEDPTTANVALPLYFEANAQKGYGYPGFRQFSRNGLKDLVRRGMRYTSGVTPNYRQSYIIDSGATGNIMGNVILNTQIVSPGANFQTRLADAGATNPDDYRGQEFPTGTPTGVHPVYLKFVRH